MRDYEKEKGRSIEQDTKCATLIEGIEIDDVRTYLTFHCGDTENYEVIKSKLEEYLLAEDRPDATPMDIGALYWQKEKGKDGKGKHGKYGKGKHGKDAGKKGKDGQRRKSERPRPQGWQRWSQLSVDSSRCRQRKTRTNRRLLRQMLEMGPQESRLLVRKHPHDDRRRAPVRSQ